MALGPNSLGDFLLEHQLFKMYRLLLQITLPTQLQGCNLQCLLEFYFEQKPSICMYRFSHSIEYYILYHVQLADLVDSLPKKLLVLVTHHHHDHIEGMVRNVLVSISLVLLYRICGIIKPRWWNGYHVVVLVIFITGRPIVHHKESESILFQNCRSFHCSEMQS